MEGKERRGRERDKTGWYIYTGKEESAIRNEGGELISKRKTCAPCDTVRQDQLIHS